MSDFEVLDFYKGGAQVIVETTGGNMTSTFEDGGAGDIVDIGYVPKGAAKPVKGPSHDVVTHGGHRHLLLKGGHVYEVLLENGDTETVDNISALGGHISVQVPDGFRVAEVHAVEE